MIQISIQFNFNSISIQIKFIFESFQMIILKIIEMKSRQKQNPIKIRTTNDSFNEFKRIL
jgi:hypothetical protein